MAERDANVPHLRLRHTITKARRRVDQFFIQINFICRFLSFNRRPSTRPSRKWTSGARLQQCHHESFESFPILRHKFTC